MRKDVFGEAIKYRFKKLDPSLDGEYCCKDKIIYIDKSLTGESLVQTLIHEECHAIFDRLGLKHVVSPDLEEIIVDSLTKWLIENYKISSK